MNENSIVQFTGRDQLSDPLNDLLKKGSENVLSAAIEAEVVAFLARLEISGRLRDAQASFVTVTIPNA